MASILVRNVNDRAVSRLKRRAEKNGRSLQAEAKDILEREAKQLTPEEARRVSESWHRRLAGRKFPDSADLIRGDRDR